MPLYTYIPYNDYYYIIIYRILGRYMSIYKYIDVYLLSISKLRLRATSLKSRRENGTDGKEGKEEEEARRETGYLLPPKYL